MTKKWVEMNKKKSGFDSRVEGYWLEDWVFLDFGRGEVADFTEGQQAYFFTDYN